MTEAQFDVFRRNEVIAPLRGKDLHDPTARTLLFGYTGLRQSWHVYLDLLGDIHVLLYNPRDILMHLSEIGIDSDKMYVPDKRLYAQCCDFDFCLQLYARGVRLPFTTYAPCRHEDQRFHGLIYQ